MSSASEYLDNAKEMLRKALSALDEAERQDYLRMAAAWTTLAQGAEEFERNSATVIPFDEPPENPLADASDL
jgi:hypothetical protein